MPDPNPTTRRRRTALLTGAAGGIGAEVARRLSAQGYRIIAVDLHAGAVSEALDGLPGIEAVECDLSDPAATAELAARIAGEWAEDLEVLICNAGIIAPGDAVDLPLEVVDRQLAVMLSGPIHVIAAAARTFTERERGHLLATVSMGGIIALPGSAAYSAAKAGLRAYLCALSAELNGTGVAVSGVYPSAVDTPMLMQEATHGGSLLNFVGKISTPSDVADAFERALRTRRLEIYVPYSDSLLTRAVESLPWLLPRLLPPMNRIGLRGRDRFLREHGVALPSPAAAAATTESAR
ncbi:SDR family oxidoreductase [Actinospica sp.]|uniref:SDR family NAD(P)-dependent oxidoreductase n=1 Tax=Actinospica sp. TaxID=1872142 RepID=UPI002CD42EEF|nr:SDR family oxidoreductase [Actinospica sp.]HWG26694.1 SDR family oxidoreductase [Actinospica sp.]